MEIVSKTDRRVRIKFNNLLEKDEFMKHMKNIPGIISLKSGKALSVIVEFKPNSTFEYILKNINETKEEPVVGKEEIYHYGNVVITHPVTKAFWSVLWLGPKRGFLTFAICTMGINRYLKAKFE